MIKFDSSLSKLNIARHLSLSRSTCITSNAQITGNGIDNIYKYIHIHYNFTELKNNAIHSDLLDKKNDACLQYLIIFEEGPQGFVLGALLIPKLHYCQ